MDNDLSEQPKHEAKSFLERGGLRVVILGTVEVRLGLLDAEPEHAAKAAKGEA